MTAPVVRVKVRFRTCKKGREEDPQPRQAGPSRIARRIALAHHVEGQIERGELRDYAEAARRLGLSRARVTQIADLALLAPDIQEAVLLGQVKPKSHQLRDIGRYRLWADQRKAFLRLFPNG